MPIQTGKRQEIMEILGSLPPEKLDQVIDFAVHLKKKRPPRTAKKQQPRLKVPTFHLGNVASHALDRETLYGEYLDRKLD